MMPRGGQICVSATVPELTDQHFRQWKAVFEHLTGIQLSAERQVAVRNLLERRLTATGVRSFDEYLQRILHTPGFSRSEWDVLVSQIVIGETRFFRHQPSFDFVARHIATSVAPGDETRPVKAWSVGCSSGEETYSLAMVLYRACRVKSATTPLTVIGTDINAASLEKAEAGIYKDIARRGVDERTATAFFERLADGQYRVREFLRNRVNFLRHNMLEPVTSALVSDVDMICCQNVLIYFQTWRRRAVIRNLLPALKVGGILILGPGELLGWRPDNLERIDAPSVQAYRRVF